MGRKSSVSRLDPESRKFLEKLIRDGRHTLDELLDAMRAKYPAADISRSGIHRYRVGFDEMLGRMREIETASAALVDELGEGVGDKAGSLLAQAVTTLATNAALNAHGNDKVSIKEVGELARAARAAMQARTMSLKEREAIEAHARKRALEDAAATAETTAKAAGLSVNGVAALRAAIMGAM